MLQNVSSKKLVLLSVIVPLLLATSAFYQQTPWKAPPSADSKKSPLTSDAATIAAGKTIYVKECQSCHGKKGKGDGTAAASLDVKAGNFSSAATQGQSDGALFWKVEEGRKPMPSFKRKITEEEAWQTVAYIRTLK